MTVFPARAGMNRLRPMRRISPRNRPEPSTSMRTAVRRSLAMLPCCPMDLMDALATLWLATPLAAYACYACLRIVWDLFAPFMRIDRG